MEQCGGPAVVCVSFLLFFSFSPCSMSNCPCNDTKPMLYDSSCSPLPNNTAIAGTGGSRVTCCTGSNNITAVWIDPFGHNVSNNSDGVINAHNPIQLKIIGSLPSHQSGAYNCSLVMNATQKKVDRLFLIVKNNSDIIAIGLPDVSNISFQVLSSHNPLSISLSFNSTSLPPTHVYWSTPSNYLNQNHYSHLLNAAEVIYSNVLLIIDIFSPSAAAGLYVANVSTSGEEFTSLNISIDVTRSVTDITYSGFNKTHALLKWKNEDIDRNNLINYIYNNETGQNVSTANDFYYYPISDNSSFNLLLYSIDDHLLPSEMQWVHFVTQGPLSSVIIDTISSTNSTCLLINWSLHQPVPTLINHALIHHYNNCSATEQQQYIKIDQNSSSLLHYSNGVCSLQAGLEYCFKISLYSPWDDVINSSYYCVNISIILSETSAPSKAPLSLHATNVRCNLTVLSWLPLHCSEWISPFSHYSVQLVESEDCSKGSYDQEITSLEPVLNLSFPRPFTDYCVRVSQVNIGNNTGPYSQGVHVKSPQCPPGKVLNLTAFVGLITAQLSWREPYSTNGVINNYTVLISTASSSSSSSRRNLSTRNKIININELLPNTAYTFSVAAVNVGGIGQLNTIMMRTRSIESIRTMNISWTLNEVTVTWYRPASIIITNIIINYNINEESGNVLLINNDTTRRWSHSVTIGDKYNYLISIAAGLYANDTLINGNFTNLNGCHGNCNTSSPLYLWIGGGGGVSLVIIIIIFIIIIVYIVWRKRSVPRANGREILLPMIARKKTGRAPYLSSTTEDINAAKGDDVVLKLCVGGEPRPDVTWFFNNQIIGDDNHYEMSEEDNTLLIHDILPMHAGVYNYTASNLHKSISGQIRVFIEKGKTEEEEEDGVKEAESDMNDHTSKIVFAIDGNYVKLSELADHIELLNKSNGGKGFKSEFQRLQSFGHLLSTEVANCSENKKRNRFKTILPYDNNLLTLHPISSRGDCSHSYINASYIDGYKKKQQFIATQGPLPQTLVDFWRLIWQEDICCILMMLSVTSDGGIVRCQQYWPDTIGAAAFYGPFKIIVERINDNEVSEERIIKLSMTSSSSSNNSCKTIHHYLFKCWPDHGVPATPTSTHSFYEQIKMWLDLPPPVLIHCSGGIGVTGVLISIMIGIEQGLSTGGVDVMAIVNKMRSQRMNMIQTEEQYQFVHYVLLEVFYTIGKESITPSNLQLIVKRLGKHDEVLNMNGYEAHYKALQVLTVKPNSVLRNFGLSNLSLVRSDLYLPPDEYRVVLNKKTEDFIHASYINGYQEARSFIVAESPTKLTAGNFWSMIMKNKCSVIVMLCDIVEMEVDTCYQYWPATYDNERHFDFYRIKHHEMNIDNYYTQTILRVFDTKANEEQTIILIQLPLSNIVSDELSHTERVGILSAIEEIEKIQRRTGNNPILVHCSDTVSRSGVFCVLYTSIQQMKIEQQVNIYEILYNMRTCKPGLITTPVQYKMVYLLLLRYVEEFEAYGNFEGQKKDTESIYND